MSGAGDKTEKPTPKRRREARRKGQIARSHDLVSWAMVLFGSIVLPGVVERGRGVATGALGDLARTMEQPELGRALAALSNAGRGIVEVLAPVMAGLCAVAIVGTVAQGGLVVSTHPLKPSVDRINPLKGLKRLFSTRSLWETGKQLVRLAVITASAWPLVEGTVREMAGQHRALADVVAHVGGASLRLVRNVAVTTLLLSAADYLFQRRQIAKGLRMSKQEVTEEHKQAEGNSQVKGKIKSLQLQASRNRMLAAVGDANVVVVNPVHLAVALRYQPGLGAPRVVARGAGAIAERIRAEAERAGVPIVESIPLARALHKACELDQEIPVELYEGVARLLAFVQRLSGRRPLGGGFHRLSEPALARA